MTHTIKLQGVDGEQVDIVLPDGRKIDILWSDCDDEALPELDIGLPCNMAVNCFGEHLTPATAENNVCHNVRQIIIPVEKQ